MKGILAGRASHPGFADGGHDAESALLKPAHSDRAACPQDGDASRFAALLTELMALNLDLIVARGTPAAADAKGLAALLGTAGKRPCCRYAGQSCHKLPPS